MNDSVGEPLISVLTVTYNGRPYLPSLLASLASQESDFPWEYVVVDNGSTDDTVEYLREASTSFPTRLTVVDGSAKPGNIPYVRNLAADEARADRLVYCDQDDIVQPGWLNAAASGLSEHGALMGLIRELVPAGTAEAEPRVMNPTVYSDLPIVESCNFAVRRSVLESVGGFDEDLAGYGMDDSELSIRLRKSGYRIVGCPEMVIHARGTASPTKRFRKVFSSAQTEILVWSKHPDVFPGRLSWRYFRRELVFNLRRGLLSALKRGGVSRSAGARAVVTSLAHAKALGMLSLGRPIRR